MPIRTFVIAAATSMLLLAAAIALACQLLIQRFDAIEADQAKDRATQALRALEADLNQLAVSTRDYAEWDDAHDYILARNPDFLRANFSFDSLHGMEVDVMALLAPDGSTLHAARIDQAAATLRDDIDPQLSARIVALRSQLGVLRQHSSTERLLRTSKGLLAFSIVEVSRSNHSGANGAVLFFGRYLHSDELQRIRQTSQLPVVFEESDPTFSGGNVSRRSGLGTRTNTAGQIIGSTFVTDWTGHPLAQLSVASERRIGSLGRRTTLSLLGTIALLVLVCMTVFGLMLARLQRHWQARIALQSRHEGILGCLDESIALVDATNGRIVEVNDALLRTLDYARSDLAQLTIASVYPDVGDLAELVAVTTVYALRECRLRTRDGRLLETEINVTMLEHAQQRLICIVGRDLSQRRQAEQQLHESRSRLAHLAEHDELTGLPNRCHLQTRLPKLLQQAATEERSVALLYIDIDHFKNLNNSGGHAIGDQLLKIIARRLRSDTAAEDVVLRVGGDEFIVVAPNPHGMSGVKALAQRLLQAIGAPIVYEHHNVAMTASIGIAVYPQDGLDGDALLKHADIALFQAKEAGRNCYQLFANDMNVQLSEHVVLEQALRRALNTNQIHIHYQPLVDLETGRLVSFEALARWQHPDMGPIPPGRFIPVAEKSGLIVPLGEQIVREVIVQLRDWQREGLALAPVAINVAPQQFERTEFAAYVHETALEFDVDPRLIAFEVTESALLQNSTKHVVMIDTLRHAGSRVYIDDFGTGFSNLSYLKSLPVDAVKIDQSFVRTVDTDANDAAIVASVVTVARQLRLKIIAEGVETTAQAQRLRELGCDYGQGYYFSKPMPAAQCRALLEQLGTARRLTETVKARAWQRMAV